MVMKALEGVWDFLVDNPAAQLVGALVLLLTGLNHILMPGQSLVVHLLALADVAGGGVELLARAVGVGVAAKGWADLREVY